MKSLTTGVLLTTFIITLATGCDDGSTGAAGPAGAEGAAGAAGAVGAAGVDATSPRLSLSFLGRGRNPDSEFDKSAVEISSYDRVSQQAFVVNAQSGKVDVFSMAVPAAPTFSATLDVAADVAAAIASIASATELGAANSVDVDSRSNTVAVAIEASPKQANGYVAFYQASDGTFLSAVEVGALPDMLMYTPDGNRVLVANEGEPNGAYSVDPEGTISIIDVAGGASTVTAANVTTVSFAAFNGTDMGDVRIFGPGATVAQDLEPEYIAVSNDNATAWIALQENNAIAEIDIATGTATAVWSLGFKNHRLVGNELDVGDKDDTINIRNWPVFSMYMPDAIAAYEVNGKQYLVTANEGDAREYYDENIADAAACTAAGGFDFDASDGCLIFIDEFDIEDALDAGATFDLPDADVASFLVDSNFDGVVNESDLNTDASLARYAMTITQGSTGTCDYSSGSIAGCNFEAIYGYGGRSFSIFDTASRQLVFDSGSDFEVITAQRLGNNFNSDNDENGSGDARSDAKGPEPEGVALGTIRGRTYAFIGLERVGGIMVYDISSPENAEFVQYITSRDFAILDVADPAVADDMDLGPEGIEFVSASDSPSGEALLLVSHEVSGTLSVYEISVE